MIEPSRRRNETLDFIYVLIASLIMQN